VFTLFESGHTLLALLTAFLNAVTLIFVSTDLSSGRGEFAARTLTCNLGFWTFSLVIFLMDCLQKLATKFALDVLSIRHAI